MSVFVHLHQDTQVFLNRWAIQPPPWTKNFWPEGSSTSLMSVTNILNTLSQYYIRLEAITGQQVKQCHLSFTPCPSDLLLCSTFRRDTKFVKSA